MSTAQHQVTNFNVDNAATYKGKIDGNSQVSAAFSAAFQCYANTVPNMALNVAAGVHRVGGQFLVISAQVTGTFVAPVTNPRIDRIALREVDALLVILPGVENAVPVAPIYPLGYIPVAQVQLAVAVAALTNSMINDERTLYRHPRMEYAYYSMERTARYARLLSALNLT